jgi:hypothetical protein
MLRHTLVAALAFALTTGSAAMAADIYKWTDANGNVHYNDRPLSESAERVAIESRSTNRAAVRAQSEANSESWAEAREARQTARDEAPTTAERRAEVEQKQQQCESYREALRKMLDSRRLYREGADGERVYLDDSQIDAARASAQSQVEEFCNS